MCVITGYFEQQPWLSWKENTLEWAKPDCASDDTKDILKRIEERLSRLEEDIIDSRNAKMKRQDI